MNIHLDGIGDGAEVAVVFAEKLSGQIDVGKRQTKPSAVAGIVYVPDRIGFHWPFICGTLKHTRFAGAVTSRDVHGPRMFLFADSRPVRPTPPTNTNFPANANSNLGQSSRKNTLTAKKGFGNSTADMPDERHFGGQRRPSMDKRLY
jgi:hypothetical protein